jgi:glycerophosphoryl diester phosphodiesterase
MKNIIFSFLTLTLIFSCKLSNKPTQSTIKVNSSIFDRFAYTGKNKPLISVHRGGGNSVGWPENCLESFQDISKKIPCLIECDIELSKDSVMVLMHDRTLDRTSDGRGPVYDMTYKELESVKLKDNFGNITNYKIPTLEKTLGWGRKNVIFTLDVKKTTPYKNVVAMVKKLNAKDYSIIITYNLNQALEVYKLDSELLISVTIMQLADYERLHEAGIPDKNMIAFIGTREPKAELIDFLHKKGIMTILGVLGNLDKKAESKGNDLYLNWLKTGVDVFATDRPEAVYGVLPK